MGQSILSVEQLVDLVKEVECEDPIDWGMLNISEEEAYRLIALDVIDMFSNADNREVIMLVTITKLILENFVLNLKLYQRG